MTKVKLKDKGQKAILPNPVLSAALLSELGFHSNVGGFENLQMPYYAKDAVLLFYNEHRTEWEQKDFYIGHGSMRNGTYYVSCFRWIDTLAQLKQVYKAITGNELAGC